MSRKWAEANLFVMPQADAAVIDGVGESTVDSKAFPLIGTDFNPYPKDETGPYEGLSGDYRIDDDTKRLGSKLQVLTRVPASALEAAKTILKAGKVVRIMAHGNRDCIGFGPETAQGVATLVVRAGDFKAAFDALRAENSNIASDLIFYSCLVGNTDEGLCLAQAIANATGIRVWASGCKNVVSPKVLVKANGMDLDDRNTVREPFKQLFTKYLGTAGMSQAELARQWAALFMKAKTKQDNVVAVRLDFAFDVELGPGQFPLAVWLLRPFEKR